MVGPALTRAREAPDGVGVVVGPSSRSPLPVRRIHRTTECGSGRTSGAGDPNAL